MDKNMINIDDLVRQRLSGGEEQERSGAWLHMRELLDQKMPATSPPAGMQWRRMFGVFAGLLLLATATVGSYHVVTSLRKDAPDGDRKILGSSAVKEPHGFAGATGTVSRPLSGTDGPAIAAVSQEVRASEAMAHYANKASVKAASASVRKQAVSQSGHADPIASGNAQSGSLKNTGNQPPSSDNAGDLTASIAPMGASGMSTASVANTINDITSPATNTVIPNTSTSRTSQPATGTGAAKHAIRSARQSGNANGQAADQPASSSAPVKPESSLASEVSSDRTSSVKENELQRLKKDTFAQLTIIRRFIMNPLTMSGRYVSDTESIGKIAIDTWVRNEVSNMKHGSSAKAASATASAVVPAASVSIKSSAAAAGLSEEMVPLANFKVKSRKTNRWDAAGFDEAVRNAKFNLAQVKFYPGITGGVNASFMGSDNINGFQLGLSGLFAFGDHWNLMAELKYLQRFNNGSLYRDDYQVPDASNPGLTSRVEHFFKFPTLQSIEMPLALRYAMNRVNVMAGPNLAYNFGLNPEEVTFKYTAEPSAGNPWANAPEKPTVSVDDFNARFSLGYLLGIAYQLSPALHLDMRMTQNVWDNASGVGAKKVSTGLYRSPSFQLSLGYRFSQNQRVPKAIEY